MKRNTIIFIVVSTTLVALFGNSENKEFYNDAQTLTTYNETQTTKPESLSSSNGDIEMKAMVDPKSGRVLGHMPLPTSWKVETMKITGPNGLSITNHTPKMFRSSQVPQMSARQIFNREMAGHISKNGGKTLRIFPLKDISNTDRIIYQQYQMSASNNTQNSYDAIGIDLLSPEGKPYLMIIRQQAHSWGYDGNWGYEVQLLECNQNYYEYAKKSLIHGIVNMQINQQIIAEFKQQENSKLQQGWAAHNQKMRSNQATFDATQRAHVASSNAISNSQMGIYRSNSASFDRTNRMEMNNIHGQETIYDPISGNSYNVDSGYDHYYMNGQGEYFGTNDHFYQPGSDLNLNGKWEEAQRYGN